MDIIKGSGYQSLLEEDDQELQNMNEVPTKEEQLEEDEDAYSDSEAVQKKKGAAGET